MAVEVHFRFRCFRTPKLRDDPRLSAPISAERVAREWAGLERALARAAAPARLHLVHLLGQAGGEALPG